MVPEIMRKLGRTEMIEDLVVTAQPIPLRFRGNYYILFYVTGDTEEEDGI